MPTELTSRFRQKTLRLPPEIRRKVIKAVILLDNDFRHPGLRSHPMKGHSGVFEAYVDDKYRMTFTREGDTFIMRNVDNHDECLKNP